MSSADEVRPPVGLVVLLASAGGLDALSIVLRDLPPEFPAAVVVQQHLGGVSSVLTTILGRQTPHLVGWAQDGQAIEPGQVTVCPPGVHMQLTRDGRCLLSRLEKGVEHRFDMLLASVARSYGAGSVAVVLSGSGQDGAVGTVAMKRSGALVVAQSADTAQYPSMPMAAARAGADLVLPVHQIGPALVGIVAGAQLPESFPGEKGSAPISTKPSWHVGEGCGAPSPDDVINSAAGRAEMARRRAAELRRRREDLSSGWGATAETAATAQRRAGESKRRAQLAHQAAQEAAARWGHGI